MDLMHIARLLIGSVCLVALTACDTTPQTNTTPQTDAPPQADSPRQVSYPHEGAAVKGLRLEVDANFVREEPGWGSPKLEFQIRFINESDRPIYIAKDNRLLVSRIEPAEFLWISIHKPDPGSFAPFTAEGVLEVPPNATKSMQYWTWSASLSQSFNKIVDGKLEDSKMNHQYQFSRDGSYEIAFAYRTNAKWAHRGWGGLNKFIKPPNKLWRGTVYSKPVTIQVTGVPPLHWPVIGPLPTPTDLKDGLYPLRNKPVLSANQSYQEYSDKSRPRASAGRAGYMLGRLPWAVRKSETFKVVSVQRRGRNFELKVQYYPSGVKNLPPATALFRCSIPALEPGTYSMRFVPQAVRLVQLDRRSEVRKIPGPQPLKPCELEFEIRK